MDTFPTHILAVDDLEENRFSLKRMLRKSEFKGKFTIVSSGEEALEHLNASPKKYTVLLLDRMMKGLSGMEVLKIMKNDKVLSKIPIIFQTALASDTDIIEGLRSGALYYITKPYPEKLVFLSIIRSAVQKFKEISYIQNEVNHTSDAIKMMDKFELRFKSLEESKKVTSLIAKAYPDAVLASIGISELLMNCVEHGNAGITYDDKSILNEDNTWKMEVERRLALDENKNKFVTVSFERNLTSIILIIKDDGSGFDWKKYIKMSPDRIFDNHGRGIVMASMKSFDEIKFIGNGSEVHAIYNLK